MANDTSYTGVERRTGLERRAVAPREAKGGPRLVTAVAVAGFGTFTPGQEKQFMDAVNKYNATAKEAGKVPLVNLEALEAAGAISGFAGRAASGGSGQHPLTRSHQTERGEREAVAVDSDEDFVIPGGVPLDVLHPLPVEVGTPAYINPSPGVSSEAGVAQESEGASGTRRATARTGGAGRTRSRSGRKR